MTLHEALTLYLMPDDWFKKMQKVYPWICQEALNTLAREERRLRNTAGTKDATHAS